MKLSNDTSRRPASHKRTGSNESVFLLERNLNTLKRQFLDLESKLKHPKPQTFQTRSPEPRSVLYEMNAKLLREKENLEKKAISAICDKARLEERVSDIRLQNCLLSKELELEHSVNQKVVNENLEMKVTLDLAERQNDLLATEVTVLREDVKLIEKIEAQKQTQLVEAKTDLVLLADKNKTLKEKNGLLEAEVAVAQSAVEILAKEKVDLREKATFWEDRCLEREQTIADLRSRNGELADDLATERIAREALQKQVVFLEADKKDLMHSLTKSYRKETEMLGEIAILRAKVALLQEKDESVEERIWRLTH